jgi:hypothetical protein
VTRRRKALLRLERAFLGGLMSVFARLVERRLPKRRRR